MPPAQSLPYVCQQPMRGFHFSLEGVFIFSQFPLLKAVKRSLQSVSWQHFICSNSSLAGDSCSLTLYSFLFFFFFNQLSKRLCCASCCENYSRIPRQSGSFPSFSTIRLFFHNMFPLRVYQLCFSFCLQRIVKTLLAQIGRVRVITFTNNHRRQLPVAERLLVTMFCQPHLVSRSFPPFLPPLHFFLISLSPPHSPPSPLSLPSTFPFPLSLLPSSSSSSSLPLLCWRHFRKRLATHNEICGKLVLELQESVLHPIWQRRLPDCSGWWTLSQQSAVLLSRCRDPSHPQVLVHPQWTRCQ